MQKRLASLTILLLATAIFISTGGLPKAYADTFGNTSTSGMAVYTQSPSQAYLVWYARFMAPSSGRLSSISFFAASPSGNGNAAIYSDGSGGTMPGSLLAQGTPQSLVNGLNTFSSQSATVMISTSTAYWLAFIMNSGGVYYGGTGLRGFAGPISCCTMPNTVTPAAGTPYSSSMAVYATYSSGSDFSITASPTSQNIGAGGTASFTLNLAVSGGFTGTVTMSISSGCPPGVTCTVTPNSVSTYPNTATLSVPTLITTSGTFNVIVSATNGTVTHTVTATAIVGSASTYNFNVRTGATQVVVTVSWSGSGTASVSIAGPGGTPTLSESGAVVYDRTTYVSGSSTPTNIHRVTFTLSSPPTGTWTAYVSLSGATVTIEVS